MKKNKPFPQLFFALVFLISFSITGQQATAKLKTITGRVTNLKQAIYNVNINIKGEERGTSTDNSGNYTIQAAVGDVLQFSFVGYKTVSILVEDVTSVLNIEMNQNENKLNEVVVLAKKVREKVDYAKVMDITFDTAAGMVNPARNGGSVHYLKGEDLIKFGAANSLEAVLGGKYSRVDYNPVTQELFIRNAKATFDIDGISYRQPAPVINFNEIRHLYIIKNRALIIIRTKNSPEEKLKRKEAIIAKHQNKNYYGNDAKEMTTEEVITSSSISFDSKIKRKTIRGIISDLSSPLANVNVSIKDKSVGTKSDKDGKYVINAEIGDIINFNYIGFKPVAVIVEDVTEVLNISMMIYANELDEVVLKVNEKSGKSGKVLERSKKVDKEFTTSRGKFNPKTAGYAVAYVDGNEISNVYGSLLEALQGKVAGYSIKNGEAYMRGGGMSVTQKYPVAWELDGVFTTTPPNIELSQIKNIRVLKSLASTNKYGTLGAGGVIVIQTKFGDFGNKNSEASKNKDKFTNKNFYSEDAESVNLDLSFSNAYTNKLQDFNDKGNAYVYYLKELQNQLEDFNIELSVAQKFISYYKDAHYSLRILKGLADRYAYQPENLKAIGYVMQSINAKKEAIEVYKKVLNLRPKYAQSYRDLANAYLENEQFKMAWRLQMHYLLQGNDLTDEGIGKLLYNEMEWLFFNRKNQTAIREKFVPNSKNADDFKNDIRLVFEWSTSEAEFDLEFVNPQRQAYVFEHSLFANQELIFNEKKKGYSSKEFMIDAIGAGEWLVNITYAGNKKSEPTYFKLTTYYNWGKATQTQETRVYKFKEQRKKIQLLKLNKQVLVSSK